jgi:predicted alpha/beta hydrolase
VVALADASSRAAPPDLRRGCPDDGEPLTLVADDGARLAARWFAAQGSAPREATLVVAAAAGVPMRFYRRFAQWCAMQGASVLAFDYRGVGRSRPARLRGFEADFSHWARDLDAVLAYALERSPHVSLLGHSIGGFLGPIAPHATALQRLLLVGAQTAHWRDWPHPLRWPMAALWHGAMPAVTLAVGYFPGRALRLGEDLPRGVALQWATRPWNDPFTHALIRQRYARALPPTHLLAAADDAFATDAALQRVHDALTGTPVRHHRIEPAAVGATRLGHFGLFREGARALWPSLLALAFEDPERTR